MQSRSAIVYLSECCVVPRVFLSRLQDDFQAAHLIGGVTMHSIEDSDERVDRNEAATMTLSKGAGYKLLNNTATVTITP
jgi:hypothetical protein